MFKRAELSECELTTMKRIWDAGEPVTCQQIMQQLRDKYELDYKDTTVYTFLKCLKQKGFVESYRRGVTYYSAVRSEKEYCEGQLKKARTFWFEGSSAKLISALLQMKDTSKEEQEEIKRIINDLD